MTAKKKTKAKAKKLPDKLSALLRLAVKDCKAVEKMKTRRLDMNTYHSPDPDGVCEVCMAGAVMDRTLRVPPSKSVSPIECGPQLADKLFAIDDMRLGCIRAAAETIGVEVSDKVAHKFGEMISKRITSWSGRAPWHVYLRAADYLERNGL